MISDEIKYFRDLNKSPDIYGQHVSDDDKKDIEKYNKENIDKKIEKMGPTADKYYQSMKLIKSVGLKPEFSTNEKEQKIIKERKEFIIKYFSKVLEDIKNYMSSISLLKIQELKKYGSDLDKFQEIMSISDSERRNYHNALINDIKILIRSININFNKNFPKEARLNFESKIPDRAGLKLEELGEIMSQREYVEFPYKQGIFIDLNSAGIDPGLERNIIANWALDMYGDLTTLNNKFNNNEDKK
jgi:hypothetical protein